MTSTFQAIQIVFTKGHIKKFGTSGKLQFCKFTGVSYKRLSFNRNASIKAKCFGKPLPNSNKVRSFSTNNQRLDRGTKFFYLDTTKVAIWYKSHLVIISTGTYMYGYANWGLHPQTCLSVGTLFLLKLFSLPLLLPWLRRPIPKQSLKYHGI